MFCGNVFSCKGTGTLLALVSLSVFNLSKVKRKLCFNRKDFSIPFALIRQRIWQKFLKKSCFATRTLPARTSSTFVGLNWLVDFLSVSPQVDILVRQVNLRFFLWR